MSKKARCSFWAPLRCVYEVANAGKYCEDHYLGHFPTASHRRFLERMHVFNSLHGTDGPGLVRHQR